MPRKITEKAVSAFLNGKKFKQGNTAVFWDKESQQMVMELHGNIIALLSDNGKRLEITDAGWHTRLTYERLSETVRQFTHGRKKVSMRKGGCLLTRFIDEWKESPLWALGDDWRTFYA
jgi:hypothetical protein